MNTTQTFWDVDGVSLQTYAYNIQTWGGDAQAPPPLRGDDVLVPHQAGRTWTPRVPDSRTITFGMWVVGANEDGSIPESGISRQLFERNWAMLRKLLWTPRRQVKLTKRFRVYGSSKVHTATALAQFSGGLNPSMTGRTRAQFTVDLLLSDPYFYGDEVELDIDPQKPVEEFIVLGDDRTTAVTAEITGSTKRLRVTNSTDPERPVWFEYGRALEKGQSATIDSQKFTATHDSDGAATPSSGNVTHEGSDHWMELEPGLVQLGVSEQDVPSRGTIWTNLSTNPSFERANGTSTVRTNGVLNPSFERASTNALNVWRTNLCPSPDMAVARAKDFAAPALVNQDFAGDFTLLTGGPFDGGYRTLEIISSTDLQTPGITFFGTIDRAKGIAITGGLTYAASLYVRGESQPFVGVPLQVFMHWYGPNNQNVEVVSPTLNGSATWQRASHVAVAPAWATEVIFGIRVAPTVITGGTFMSVASVLLENASEVLPFFSGSTPPGMLNAQYSWKGTAGLSQSIMTLSAPVTYRNDAINPSFEGGLPQSVLVTNEATNPGFEDPTAAINLAVNPDLATAANNWGVGERIGDSTGFGRELTRQVGGGPVGIPNYVYSTNVAKSPDTTRWYIFSSTGSTTVVPGQTYTLSMWGKSEGPIPVQARLRAFWGVGNYSVGPATQEAPGKWFKRTLTVTAPVNATALAVEMEISDFQPDGVPATACAAGVMAVPVANINTPYSGNFFAGTKTANTVKMVNRLDNPSFEASSSIYVFRRNYCLNPSLTTTANFWESLGFGSGAGTLARTGTGGQIGGYYRKTFTTADSAAVDVGFSTSTTNMITAVPGAKQAVSGYMRASIGYRAIIQAVYYTSALTVLSTSNGTLPYTQLGEDWTPVNNVFTVPANAAFVVYKFTNSVAANAVATATIDLSGGVLIEDGQIFRTYFDATTPSTGEFADLTATWQGAANASPSILNGNVPTFVDFPTAAVPAQTRLSSGLRPFGVRVRPVSTITGINNYIEPGRGYAAGIIRTGMTAGKSYTLMATIIRPNDLVTSATKSAAALTVSLMYTLPDNVVYAVSSPAAPSTAGRSIVRARARIPAEATAAWIRLTAGYPQGDSGTDITNEVIFDDVAVIEQEGNSSAPTYDGPYFDGASLPTAEHTYAWSAGANTSPSTQSKTGYVGTTNVFENPSFETVTGTVPDDVGQVSNATASSSTDWAARGTKSLRITPTSTSNNTYVYLQAANLLTSGHVLPETTYRVVGTVRIAQAQTGTLSTYARKIVAVGAVMGTLASEEVPNTPGVYDVELLFRVPGSESQVQLRLYNGAGSGGGDVFWDQVAVFQNDARPYNSVTGIPVTGAPAYHTGFYFDGNTITTDEYVQMWQGAAHASRSYRRSSYPAGTLPDGARANQSVEWKSSGSHSLKVIPSSSTTGGDAGVYLGVPTVANSFMPLGLQAGKTYTASIKVHLDNVITGNLSAHALSLALDYGSSTFSHTSLYSAPTPNVAGDNTLRFTFTVPLGASYTALRFIHGGAQGSGVLYLDEFQLVTAGNYAGNFFSGNSTSNQDFQYDWKGLPNESASTRSASLISSGVGVNAVAVRSSNWASSGLYSVRISPNSTTSNDSYLPIGGDVGGLRLDFIPGGRYTVMAKRRLTAPLTGTLQSRAGKIVVFTKVGTAGYVETSSSPLENTAGVTDVRVTFTVPVGATEAFVRLYAGGFAGSGDVWWDDVLVTPVGFDSELGYLGDYFDGDTAATADYSYSWNKLNDRIGSSSSKRAIAAAQVASNSVASSSGISFQSATRVFSTERPRSLQILPTGASNFTFATLVGTVMLPNKTYLLRGRVYLPKAQTGKLNASARKITVAWSGYPGYLTTTFEQQAENSAGWQEYVAVVNTPPTGTLTAVYLWNGSSETDGPVWWDDVMVTDSADQSVSYFDGSMTVSGGFNNAWTGAPGASTSTQSAAGIAGVSSSGTAAAYQAGDWALSGTKSLRITPTSLTSNDTYATVGVDLAPGTYTIMATVRLKEPQAGSLSDRARRIFMADSSRQYISHPAPNTAGEHEIRWNITTTGRVLLFRLYNGASANMGDVWWDGLVIIKQDEDLTPYTGPYFDGSTKDTEYADYEWTGAPHFSTSIIRGVSSTENVKIRYRPVWL
jgi:hypothetical protein